MWLGLELGFLEQDSTTRASLTPSRNGFITLHPGTVANSNNMGLVEKGHLSSHAAEGPSAGKGPQCPRTKEPQESTGFEKHKSQQWNMRVR